MTQEPLDAPAPGYGAPVADVKPVDELSAPPQMSPFSRLANVFFAPGEVFQDVRRSPRDWWLPLIVLLLISLGVGYFVQQRLGFTPERLAAAAVDLQLEQQGKTRKDFTPEQQTQFGQQEKFTAAIIKYSPIVALIFAPIFVLASAGIYFALVAIAGAKTTYFRVVAVLTYAFFVPNLLKTLLNVVLAFISDPETADPGLYMQNQGLISASPAALFSPTESPVLYTFLSYFDVFSIWYLALVAIGLSIIPVKRMKMATAAIIAFGPYVLVMIGATLIKMLTT
jgi:hypothetical protein